MTFMAHPQPSGGFEWRQEPWGASLRCGPLAGVAVHLFTAGDLRLVDDEQEWRAAAGGVGVAPEQLRLLSQVHGVEVAIVRRSGSAGGWSRPEADVIVSDDPDVAIGVRVADCAPILIADRRTGAVAAVHAGWRGTAHDAAGTAVGAMRRTFGSAPGDLVAAIGPCLGPCCGEVGPEVVDAFRREGASEAELARWFTPGSGRPFLNLWAANRDQLSRAGIPAAQIHAAEICTRTHAAVMHSYRAQGAGAGRMAALIRARRSAA